jgi:uncharacterized RDD family membrane protein YckC
MWAAAAPQRQRPRFGSDPACRAHRRQAEGETAVANLRAHAPVVPDEVAFAGFGRRLAAALLDWMIFSMGSTFVLMILVFIPIPYLFVVASPVLSIGFFAWLWTRAQSPGMGALGYRLVDAATSGRPRWRRLIPRAGGALLLYADVAAIAFLPWWLADAELSAAMTWAIFGAVLFVGMLVIVAHLWMLWDPRRRTLIDKLCGVVAVKDRRREQWVWSPASDAAAIASNERG